MNLPLVSIITPSFNQGRFLGATIQSVLDQDYPQVEYILIDGGSQDGSLEVIQQYKARLAYWESQADRGQAHAINKGFEHASGQILGWINSDDLLLPSTVSRAVAALDQHPEAQAVYGRLERVDEDGCLIPTPLLPKDRVVFGVDNFLHECSVNQAGCFWRREIMPGLLDESLQYVMDYDYWIRMLLAGGRFMRLPEVVARFRLSRQSKTVGQALKMARESLALIDRYSIRPGLPASLGISPAQVARQARRGRSLFAMNACIACIKEKRFSDALGWLLYAHRSNPGVLFSSRWAGLAWAGVRRRLKTNHS